MNDKHMIINGTGYTRDDAIAAPVFVDADGETIAVGDAVRVRLSSLKTHDMDEDNRHGTIRTLGHDNIGVEFPHRLCNGHTLDGSVKEGFGRFFNTNEIRRD